MNTVELEGTTTRALKSSIRLWNSLRLAALMTVGKLQHMLERGVSPALCEWVRSGVTMDERIVKQTFPATGEECAPSGRKRGVAEIITLDSARHRKKAPTPNDPPDVPIDEHIGRHLKAIYDDVLQQPIPDRFLDLLNQLGDEPGRDGEA
jgi:hypothetical protein